MDILKRYLIEVVIFSTAFGLSVMAIGFLASGDFVYGTFFIFMLLLFQMFVILGAKGDKEFPKAYDKDIKDVGLFTSLSLIYLGLFVAGILTMFIR